jgi:hypothetical protein
MLPLLDVILEMSLPEKDVFLSDITTATSAEPDKPLNSIGPKVK